MVYRREINTSPDEQEYDLPVERVEDGEQRVDVLVEQIEAAASIVADEMDHLDAVPLISSKERAGIIERLQRSPLSRGLQALILGVTLLGAARADAEGPMPPTSAEKSQDLDLKKTAVSDEAKTILMECKKECGAGILEVHMQQWAQEAHVGNKSFQWDARGYFGPLGSGADVTLADEDRMAHRVGIGARSAARATVVSNPHWEVERVKDITLQFTGAIPVPSMALEELVKHFVKREGLEGAVSVSVGYRWGGFGGQVSFTAVDKKERKAEFRTTPSSRVTDEVAFMDRALHHELDKKLDLHK